MKYYRIKDRTDSCFGANVPGGTRIVCPGGCKECTFPLPGQGPPEDLVVCDANEQFPDRAALCFTSWGFGVIHVDMFTTLGREGEECLLLGSMRNTEGQPIPNYRTYVGACPLLVRGDKKAYHSLCSKCGRMFYNPWPSSPAYVTKASLRFQRPIYHLNITGLLINETLLSRIEPWRGLLTVQPIKVRETPLDGLPAELDEFPTAAQLEGYIPRPWRSSFSKQKEKA